MIEGDKGLNIVFTGDSITHGPLHTKGYRSYTEHFRILYHQRKYMKSLIQKTRQNFFISSAQKNHRSHSSYVCKNSDC